MVIHQVVCKELSNPFKEAWISPSCLCNQFIQTASIFYWHTCSKVLDMVITQEASDASQHILGLNSQLSTAMGCRKSYLTLNSTGHVLMKSVRNWISVFVSQFKNNIPLCNIAKNSCLSPFTVHNTIKSLRRKGQEWKALLRLCMTFKGSDCTAWVDSRTTVTEHKSLPQPHFTVQKCCQVLWNQNKVCTFMIFLENTLSTQIHYHKPYKTVTSTQLQFQVKYCTFHIYFRPVLVVM